LAPDEACTFESEDHLVDRRRGDAEVPLHLPHRNAERARIKWMFTTEKARAKMGRAYPKPGAKSARLKESNPP
jgi:hypothetical protein